MKHKSGEKVRLTSISHGNWMFGTGDAGRVFTIESVKHSWWGVGTPYEGEDAYCLYDGDRCMGMARECEVESMEYKVGDRVKIVRCIPSSDSGHYGKGCWCIGLEGVVDRVDTVDYPLHVRLDRATNGETAICCKPEALQLLKREDTVVVCDQATADAWVDLWSSPDWHTYYSTSFQEESLKEKTMRKLSELEQSVRRVFDADQKALWRTNRIDKCGKWSEDAIQEGNRDMVIAHLDANRKEYVDRANEEITLAKEEKE